MTHFPYNGSSTHRVCFVAEPYAGTDAARVHENNLVFDEIVEPSVSAHGYRLIRSTELCRPNYVTREHQRMAEDETLLVANLSYYDPVVFYCVAWRLARKPGAPILVLLRHDQDRLVETPVLTQAPVLYDLSAPRQVDVNYTEEEKADAIRRKLQLARRDLTRLVQHQGELERQNAASPTSPPPPPPPSSGPAGSAPPGPGPGPGPGPFDSPADCRTMIEEIVCELMKRTLQRRPGDITDTLFDTLVKKTW